MAPGTSAGAAKTRLAYQTEPRRKTLLTRVRATRGTGVELEAAIHHAAQPAYHHRVPADRGHVLAEGHKLKIQGGSWRNGRLVHQFTGPPPAHGAKALIHLDWPRRHLAMRAHAAMHLLVKAVMDAERGGFASGPRVVGGGGIRAELNLPDPTPAGIARIQNRVNEWIQQRLPLEAVWMTRDDAQVRTSAQPWRIEDVCPSEPSLRVVRVGDVSTLPCDGPHVENTREVGTFRITRVEPKGTVRRIHGQVFEE